MAVQAEISHTRLRQRVGRECKVLIDEVTEAGAVGRSASESPEVDGVIHLPGVTGIQAGDFVKVKITACDTHDLTASLIEL
jgi:ribosomal protein S12 methylthiotransferase